MCGFQAHREERHYYFVAQARSTHAGLGNLRAFATRVAPNPSVYQVCRMKRSQILKDSLATYCDVSIISVIKYKKLESIV
jgi:hypothetical protein